MKKWFGSIVAVTLILAPVNAIAAVKAGDVCKKLEVQQLQMARNLIVLRVARNLFGIRA